MKPKSLLPLFFFVFYHISFAQITFQKEYHDNSIYASPPSATANDMKPTSDGGYIVTGFITDSIFYQFAYLMKLDSYGDTVWTKQYQEYSLGSASVLQTCDSGYLTVGSGGLLKTNSSGDVLWAKSYPDISNQYSPTNMYGISCCKSSDCGYVIATSTQSYGAGGYDVFVIKTDTGGNPVWSRTYGGTGDDEATSIQPTADGGYIIAGYTNSFDTSGRYSCYIIKINAIGDTLWTKKYGPSLALGSSYFVKQTYDKGYIFWGFNNMKTDSMGNVTWSKSVGLNSIIQTPDTGYVFTSGITGDYLDLLLIKEDKNGNFIWARDFPSTNEAYRLGTSVLQANDGGYVILDYTERVHQPVEDYIDLIKTDANGHSGCSQKDTTITLSNFAVISSSVPTVVTSPTTTATADSSINASAMPILINTLCSTGIGDERTKKPSVVYPTLVAPNSSINISFNQDLTGATVTVFNMLGVALFSEVVSGKGNMVLNALKGKLSTGMYFVRIMQDGKMSVQKVVVM